MEYIWVTGANGFSGGYIIQSIQKLLPDYKIVAIDIHPGTEKNAGCYEQCDLLNADEIDALCKKYPPAYIIHSAGLMPPRFSAGELWAGNVGLTYNLLSVLLKNSLLSCRVLLIGSAAEYILNEDGYYTEQSPVGGVNDYGRTKTAQTMLMKGMVSETGLNVTMARTFNLIGPGLPSQYVASELCQQYAQTQGDINIGNIEAVRDFVDIRDVARAYIDILEQGASGEVYNVCSGRPIKISQLIETLNTICKVERQPAISDEKMGRKEVLRVYGSSERLTALSGWKPEVSLMQSLTDMLRGYV